jgi:UDP-N-acetylmuramoylalanine--D-glutamate ligase
MHKRCPTGLSLGAGESGVGFGYSCKKQDLDVFVSDLGQVKPLYRDVMNQRGITFEEGRHSEERILRADLIVKSPGIPEKAPC